MLGLHPIWSNGENVKQGPREALRDLVNKAAEIGFKIKTGVEPNFSLNDQGDALSDASDTSLKPCYDQTPFYANDVMEKFAIIY